MRRGLAFACATLLLAGCEEEHGAAPRGTFAPGGPVDDRGNAAVSRALRGDGAEAPVPEPEGRPPGVVPSAPMPERVADRADAGAFDTAPIAGQIGGVEGRVIAADEESLRIEPAEGPPIVLRLDETAQITRGGTLTSRQSLQPGVEVRASYRVQEAGPVAQNVVVLEPPRRLGRAPAEE